MPDPATASLIDNIGSVIAGVAALGTTSMGLVDASKAFAGGPSNIGFGIIRGAIEPFLPHGAGMSGFNRETVLATLKANWINGVAKADQKAMAKALIHLGLTTGNAAQFATATGVDGALLASLATKTRSGQAATPEELGVLGQFDAILSAILDTAYEKGDQQYRNWSKLLGTAISTVLGVVAAWLLGTSGWLGLIVGLAATPLAPIAKDLASSLQAAATAVQTVRRGFRQ
jgi:hypothetical protein